MQRRAGPARLICVEAELTDKSDVPGTPVGAVADSSDPPGEGSAVTELFRAHHLELVGLAMVMTGDLSTAQDVVQDVFERLHRRWPVLRSENASLGYIRASVLNGRTAAASEVARPAFDVIGRGSPGSEWIRLGRLTSRCRLPLALHLLLVRPDGGERGIVGDVGDRVERAVLTVGAGGLAPAIRPHAELLA